MNIAKTSLPRVVIIGGGFAGLATINGLKDQEVQVVLIDKHNYHTFQPLLYQVATGGLEPDSIAYPLRKVIKDIPNFYFRLAEVSNIDTNKRKIHTNIGKLKYDYLIIATGSKTNYFGNTNIEKFSMAMKNVPQSLNLRSLILENFEDALLTSNLEERNALMNFVIVGGGPTGVELAGALAEMKKGILPKDYPDLDIRQMQINIVQGGRLLKAMSEKASEKAEDFLIKLGVNIYKSVHVTNYDGYNVETDTDLAFKSCTVIWAAGVSGELINGLEGECVIERAARIKVDEFNKVIGYKNIFAIGDIACMDTKEFPKGHPMMAQPAIQQGKHLAKNLIAQLENKDIRPFKYNDKGSMATIGRNKAVVDLPKWKFQGVFAWFVWMFVHLFSLIGFRNRAVVFFNWVYNYIRFDRETRLIIRPFKNKNKQSF
ncbi:NAD(P)/FAD-dependent oxidoreductase [Lutibacter citreus]|uniref:NAD(P)/FAD-dependent oxidoreductase n=1 Tax=Lutibacter citreus TaxID=2138210 RepID=UPI000DBE613A|nr:NAD(P)/FAD-dependent oxidoreductase [Lutibacter citreus]